MAGEWQSPRALSVGDRFRFIRAAIDDGALDASEFVVVMDGGEKKFVSDRPGNRPKSFVAGDLVERVSANASS